MIRILRIEGTADGAAAAILDMGVDHSRADVLVAEKLLDGADIVSVFQEVGGEAVAERVAAPVRISSAPIFSGFRGPWKAMNRRTVEM